MIEARVNRAPRCIANKAGNRKIKEYFCLGVVFVVSAAYAASPGVVLVVNLKKTLYNLKDG